MEVIGDLYGSNLFGVVGTTVQLNIQKMMHHEKRDSNVDGFFKNFCKGK